jgi:hypothetical protein
MIRTSAQHENERKQNNTQDDNDLERRQPEFEFTEETDSEIVNADDSDQEDGDPYARIDLFRRNPV